ncbi:MAG TPA: hypothetical protein VMS31_13820 [Pyrinomonadaceae bacterium]|nr:hypothetical protein [Pyrinomonadaceae bacterium]
MKKLIPSLLSLLCLAASVSFAQNRRQPAPAQPAQPSPQGGVVVDSLTGQTVVCKGTQLPDGLVVSGEMFTDTCRGTAWVVRPKAGAPPALDITTRRLTTNVSYSMSAANEVVRPGQCDTFNQTIKHTYNFKPANFNDAQRRAKSAELDQFWNQVRESAPVLVPCLRKALRDDTSPSFFSFDGSMLLVDIDPSDASKALQVREFIDADLDGTDLEFWVKTMARRGVEGFDTSGAGAKWLSYPNAKYTLSMHGGYPIGPFLGAVFIFGSMEEDLATPVLARIANQADHPHRTDAIAILSSQATPAALRALRELNPAGLSAENRQSLRELVANPKLLQARARPKLTREENLRAFQGIINGDYSAFREMVMKAPDGEVDAVATLLPEDIPLLRRARRASISRCNQHAVSDYASFTAILWALTWKP